MLRHGFLLLIGLSVAFNVSFAQQKRSNLADTIVNAKLLHLSYQYQIPFADMADRFGSNNNFGASLIFKMKKNFLFGAEINLMTGGNIHEDTIIDGLLTSNGFLIGVNGLAESAILYERGYTIFGKVGKMIPVAGSGPNTGLNAMIGAGFIQHRIKIQDPDGVLPYIQGDYAKGYDRLSNGLALSQYLGYLHLDKRKLLNFNTGIEVVEGFTQSRRDYNFDQMKKDDSKQLDILLGFKFSWLVPFYGKGEQRFYTY